MVVFYHSDDDGKCAGYWAGKLNKRKTGVKDDVVDYIMINYGWPIPWDKISKDELVYIVDFSFSVEDMNKLLELTSNVVWIDHHISAIEKYADYDKHVDGIRLDGAAGCLLTYFYLTCLVDAEGHEDATLLGQFEKFAAAEPSFITAQSLVLQYVVEISGIVIPAFTLLIADWDIWEFMYGDMTKNFHIGFSMIPHQPKDSIWDSLQLPSETSFSRCEPIIREGATAKKYRSHWMENYCAAVGFEARFKDPELRNYSCFAINIAHISSDDFVIDTSSYDVLIGFSFDGEIWTYSLRAARPSIDVSVIAQCLGGGGHKGAAGFTSRFLEIERAD